MNLALNPFDRGKKPERVDDIVLKDEKIARVFEAYNRFHYNPYWPQAPYPLNSLFMNLQIEVLTPDEIDRVVSVLEAKENGKHMGLVNKLLQDSYHAGYNDFVLSNPPKLWMLSYLKGKQNKLLRLTVEGDVLFNLGCNSSYCHFIVIGDVGPNCGAASHHCIFELYGRILNPSQFWAYDSESVFIVKDKTAKGPGRNRVIYI